MIDEKTFFSIVKRAKKYDQLAFMFKDKLLHCSFCGKSQNEIEKLVAGKDVYICNECVGLCVEIIEKEKTEINEEKKV